MGRKLWIDMGSVLVLVKLDGKKRLGNIYTREERRRLVLFLFERLIRVLNGLNVYVGTSDDISGDFVVIKDEWGDVNSVIKKAREVIKDDLLVLPCDLPFVEREDVDRLMGGKVMIVPSQDGGTNALFLPLNVRVKTQFGENSLRKHIRIFEKENLPYGIVESDHFRDIDTKEDIEWTLKCKGDSDFSRVIKEEIG